MSEASKELARWFDASSETLEALRALLAASSRPPGALRCWPHHFDLAMLVPLDAGGGEAARSVGIGVSPGDAHLPEPYAYVGPWTSRTGEFWNQSFGAAQPVSALGDADAVTAFFREGAERAAADPAAEGTAR